MNDLALLVRLQARIATFLAELTPDRLLALAEGGVRLAVVEGGESTSHATGITPSVTFPERSPVPPSDRKSAEPPTASARRGSSTLNGNFDAESVAAQLRACGTVDEATQRLASLRLSAVNLKLVAKALNIPAARTKDETAKRILNLTVGARGKHAGLRQG